MAAKFALYIVLFAVLYGVYQHWTSIPVPGVQGSCTPAFKEVEEAYRASFASGHDLGSSLALYYKGELVCDVWGGWADETNSLPWSKDTVSLLFSTTKGVSAIAFALLYERGLVNYDDLVSKYWPEFAQNGKAKITVGQVLSHQAGLAAMDEDITLEDVREHPEKVSKAIEKQKPNWPPGTQHGYHALTFALPVDQLIRRIDPNHRGLDQFFREEIAEPYGIDVEIGLPYAKHWRAARSSPFSGIWGTIKKLTNAEYMQFIFSMMTNSDPLLLRAFSNPLLSDKGYNWPDTRATPLGSALGYGSARGVARLYSMVADPANHERQILSDDTRKTLTTVQTLGKGDYILGANTTFGYGVMIGKADQKHMVFHHPGYGGQVGAGIPDLNLGIGYITNYLGCYLDSFDDERVKPLYRAILDSIKKLRNL